MNIPQSTKLFVGYSMWSYDTVCDHMIQYVIIACMYACMSTYPHIMDSYHQVFNLFNVKGVKGVSHCNKPDKNYNHTIQFLLHF